ncbi:MAG: hypothetical protein K2K12_01925, partial [Clostridia bacterium]|nr:hypothetical protein [Clostridia bacterium]
MNDNNFNDEFDVKKETASTPPAGGAPVHSAPPAGGVPAKSTRTKKILIAAGAVVIALVFFFVGWIVRYFTIDSRARTLLWLIDTIEDNYYKEIPDEKWDELYAQFYEMALPDKFCSYFTPEEFKQLLSEGEGSNKDAGFSAIDEDDSLRVYNVIGNSPAALAGLKSGMYIYSFGTSKDNLQEGDRNALYSLSGSAIYLECGYGKDDTKVYCITGDTYLASYCSYRDSDSSFDFRGTEKLELTETNNPLTGADGKTAYISICEFNGNVAEEFVQMLDLMKERGRENLIIDLRRNGGGYLKDFQSIA